MALHNHMLVRGRTYDVPDQDTLRLWLINLVTKLDMKILQGPFISYVDVEGNKGLTAVVMIETSHIAIHIWDEEHPALVQFDVYTCGELNVDLVIEELRSIGVDVGDGRYIVINREESFHITEAFI